jgi:VanZ family protein
LRQTRTGTGKKPACEQPELTVTVDKARKLSLLLACLWAGVIFYLSHQPGTLEQPLFPQQDKLLHLMAYAVLGFLGMGSVRATAHGYRPAQAWVVCLLVGLYGVTDEFHQHFIPGRMVDGFDVVADIAGGLLGTWLMYYLVRRAIRHRQLQAG